MFLHYVVSTALDLESTLPVSISASLLSIQLTGLREPLKLCLHREMRCLLMIFREAEPHQTRIRRFTPHYRTLYNGFSHRTTCNALVDYFRERGSYPFHAGASVFGGI
jgi:hypothetical protein